MRNKTTCYRLDKQRLDGSYCGSIHFDTLLEAERHLKDYNYRIEVEANIMQTNTRYGTIWETSI